MHNINEKRARLQNSFAMLKLNMSSPKYLSWRHCKRTMSASDNRYTKDDIPSRIVQGRRANDSFLLADGRYARLIADVEESKCGTNRGARNSAKHTSARSQHRTGGRLNGKVRSGTTKP